MDASMLDEEHIRLAFERIDTTHVGYITKYGHTSIKRGVGGLGFACVACLVSVWFDVIRC